MLCSDRSHDYGDDPTAIRIHQPREPVAVFLQVSLAATIGTAADPSSPIGTSQQLSPRLRPLLPGAGCGLLNQAC
jgi:hypothetical protein